jgi:hypothetical protein
VTGIGRVGLGCAILALAAAWSTAQEIVPLAPQSPGTAGAGDSGGGIWQTTGRIVNDKLSGQIAGLNGEATGQAAPVAISLVQDGKVVASAVSDGFGVFQVPNLSPGTYSLLLYGPDGISAVSVEVLPASSQIIPAAEGAAADSGTLTVNVVPTADVDPLNSAMGGGGSSPSVAASQGTIPSDSPPAAPGGGGGWWGWRRRWCQWRRRWRGRQPNAVVG